MLKTDSLVNSLCRSHQIFALVAQLDRVTDSDSVGRRFDPCRVHHNISDLQKIVKLKNTANWLMIRPVR